MKSMIKNLKIVTLVSLSLLLFNCSSIERMTSDHIRKLNLQVAEIKNTPITFDEIKSLPQPVQRYLKYSGIIGRERIINAKIHFEGEFKMNKKSDWKKVNGVFFDNIPELTRIFYMKMSIMGIPIVGKDIYINGKGCMKGKVMSLFTIFNESGMQFDIGELVTLLNDFIFLPSAFLDKRIIWNVIDDNSAKATLKDHGNEVSAVFYFNETGQITNFITIDRFAESEDPNSKEKYQRTKWSTPLKNYKKINGINVPTEGDAIWHYKSGEFCYAKFQIKKIEYNVKK